MTTGERIEIWRRNYMDDGEWEQFLVLPLSPPGEWIEYRVQYFDGDPNYSDTVPDLEWRL